MTTFPSNQEISTEKACRTASFFLILFAPCGAEDHRRCTDGDDGSVVEPQAVLGTEHGIADKGAGAVGAGVAQCVDKLSGTIPTDVNNAMRGIYAGVNGLNGSIDIGALNIAPNHIVTHL